MNLRPMETGDAPAVAPLFEQLGYPVGAAELERRLRELDRNRSGVFVAEDEGGALVGWIHVCHRDHLLVTRQAEIVGLVVAQGTRGRGIGRRLVDRAEAWARQRGLASVRVTSNVERREAHPFYLRLGYGRTKTSAVYHKNLA